MTYSEAGTKAREGKAIRHPDHSPGWKIVAHNDVLFCVNPRTGSDYQYMPSTEDVLRKDWSTV